VVAAGLFCLRFGSLFKLSVSEGDWKSCSISKRLKSNDWHMRHWALWQPFASSCAGLLIFDFVHCLNSMFPADNCKSCSILNQCKW
jgi:hypothetical protein